MFNFESLSFLNIRRAASRLCPWRPVEARRAASGAGRRVGSGRGGEAIQRLSQADCGACRAASPRAAATKRASRIQEARARGEPVREIASRENVSLSTVVYVRKTKPSHFERAPSSSAAERDAKLRAVAAHLDRPALKNWSVAHDTIVAATQAIQQARPHPCPAAMFDALQAALAALRMELTTLNVRIEDEAE